MSYISQLFCCRYRTGCKKNHRRNQNKYFSHFFFAPKKECAISKFIRQIYTNFPQYITAQLKFQYKHTNHSLCRLVCGYLVIEKLSLNC